MRGIKGLGASGPKRARTHISFYSILFYSILFYSMGSSSRATYQMTTVVTRNSKIFNIRKLQGLNLKKHKKLYFITLDDG